MCGAGVKKALRRRNEIDERRGFCGGHGSDAVTRTQRILEGRRRDAIIQAFIGHKDEFFLRLGAA